MIEQWMTVPLAIRFGLLACVGLVLGGFINWGIYTLAYFPRPISPWISNRVWAKEHPKASPRKGADRVPVFGWLRLRRESAIHGRGFWIRPLLIEIGFAIAVCGLYEFEAMRWLLIDVDIVKAIAARPLLAGSISYWMHVIFFAHVCLLTLMAIATFIDFDEQTVPDFITIPGTLLGFLLATISQQVFPPFLLDNAGTFSFQPALLSAPYSWHPKWNGTAGLWLGLGLFAGWCFALADRRIILRKGLKQAIRFFFAGIVRYPTWKLLLAIWMLGSAAIVGVWFWGGTHWPGLLSSLTGMAVGGGSVWAVRVIASAAMGQEAMGFGDVTLMGMIGAFVGWQAAIIAFPIAPMTAILIVLIQYALTRNRVVAFGPYLCAGTVVTMLGWPYLWNQFGVVAFSLGPIFPIILVVLLLMMGSMLMIWRWIKQRVFGYG